MGRRTLMLAVVVGLLGGALADGGVQAAHAQVRQRRRQARRFRAPRIPDSVAIERDVVYGTGGGRDLKMDIVRPKQAPAQRMPVLVYIHGGGWRAGNKVGGIRRLIPFVMRGYFGATIEYRLTGEAVFPAQIEDCKCAIRFLRAKADTYHIDPNRIGVWGTSAGGHLVALLGTSGGVKALEGTGGWQEFSSRVQAVCDFCGPGDLSAMFGLKRPMDRNPRRRSPEIALLGGTYKEKQQLAILASPVTHATPDDPPFLIAHGDEDPVVPLDQAFRMYKAMAKVGVWADLYIVNGHGHGVPMNPETTQTVTAFFDRFLCRPKATGPPATQATPRAN